MTFTSNKSMEIEVLVDADPVVDSTQKRYRAASAFFTYVSLSQEGKSLPVPQLVVSGTWERQLLQLTVPLGHTQSRSLLPSGSLSSHVSLEGG